MKKNQRLVLLGLLLAVVAIGCSIPAGSTKTYNIGDTGPAGGIVFYDRGSTIDGWRYLEVTPFDQSASIGWGSYLITTGATGTAIGTGRANTDAIVSANGAGTYAARLGKNMTLHGYSDWFLPSKDEIAQVLQNLTSAGIVVFVDQKTYWTSSEVDVGHAWTFWATGSTANFSSSTVDKMYPLLVRAIREF